MTFLIMTLKTVTISRMELSIMTPNKKILSITTFTPMIFIIRTVSTMTISIMTLNINKDS
jgi:hypothetical protein